MSYTEYAINTTDGRIVFRTPEVDEQINYFPISKDIVMRIVNKKLKVEDVLKAVTKKIKEKDNFNLHEYLENLKKLNVRTSNIVEEDKSYELEDRSSEEITLKDVSSQKNTQKNEKEVPKKEVQKDESPKESPKQEAPKDKTPEEEIEESLGL